MLSAIGRLAERAFCFFAISVLIGAYMELPLKLSGASIEGDSDPYAVACRWVLLGGVAILFLAHWKASISVARQGGLINLFLLVSLTSIAWSIDPLFSLRRVVREVGAVGLAYVMIARFPMHQIIRKLAFALAMSALISVLVAVAVPRVGVMGAAPGLMDEGEALAGTWSGVFVHKNLLGQATFLGCLCCGWLWVHEPNRRILNGLGVLACLVAALGTRSKTTLVAISLIPLIGLGFRGLRFTGLARLWIAYSLVIGLIVGSVLFFGYFNDLMVALGRDPELTGRVPIWTLLLEFVGQRPLLGYGFAAFWSDSSTPANTVWAILDFKIAEAHEGYIDALLGLGILGLLILLAILLLAVRRSLSSPVDLSWASFAWVYTITLIITNFSESVIFDDLHLAILSIVYAELSRQIANPQLKSDIFIAAGPVIARPQGGTAVPPSFTANS